MYCTKTSLTSSYVSLHESENLPSRIRVFVSASNDKFLAKAWNCPLGSQIAPNDVCNVFPYIEIKETSMIPEWESFAEKNTRGHYAIANESIGIRLVEKHANRWAQKQNSNSSTLRNSRMNIFKIWLLIIFWIKSISFMRLIRKPVSIILKKILENMCFVSVSFNT